MEAEVGAATPEHGAVDLGAEASGETGEGAERTDAQPAPQPGGTTGASAVLTNDDAPPPESPRQHRFSVSLEDRVLWLKNPGYDLFSDDDVSNGIGFSVAGDLLRLGPALVLAPELGLLIERAQSTVLGGALDSEVAVTTYLAGASLRYELASFATLHSRMVLGAERRTLNLIANYDDPEDVEQKRWGMTASLGAGATLQLPPRGAVAPGLLVEGGYCLATTQELRLENETNDDAIPVEGASLGELGRSGPYLRLAAFLRF